MKRSKKSASLKSKKKNRQI